MLAQVRARKHTRASATAMEMGSPIASGARTRSQNNAGSSRGGCGSAMEMGSPVPGVRVCVCVWVCVGVWVCVCVYIGGCL